MKTLPSAFKYLVWPGLMLVTAGLVVGALNGWTGVAVGLLVVGAIAILGAIASGSYSGFWQQRSTLAGTNAVVSVLSVFLILGLINLLGNSYSWRTDLTEGQLLSLSPASQDAVESLEQPTELLLFSRLPNPTEKKLLDNYRRYNSDFTYRYVDPTADPQLAGQFNVQTGNEAFLQAGEKTVAVQRPASQAGVEGQLAIEERTLTNKLAQLSQTESAVIYFLQGHEEYDITGSQAGYFEAATQLREQNYTVEPLNLVETNVIPSDADVLAIGGPRQELFDSEIEAIEDYLNAGGSVFVLVDPQAETGIEKLLAPWGVLPEDAIVIDTSGGGQLVGLGPAAPLVTDYGNHPITEAFGTGRSFYPVTRPLSIAEVEGVQVTPLLFTAENSQAQPILEGEELTVDSEQEPEGPFVIGAALTRPVEAAAANAGEEDTILEQIEGDANESEADESEADEPEADEEASEEAETDEVEADQETSEEDSELEDLGLEDSPTADEQATENSDDTAPEESRLVVIGNSSFATDGLFSQQLNGDVFLNSVNWLSKIDNPTLSVQPKEITNRRFEMTVQQQIFLTLLALVVFPLAGLVGAGVLWARRR